MRKAVQFMNHNASAITKIKLVLSKIWIFLVAVFIVVVAATVLSYIISGGRLSEQNKVTAVRSEVPLPLSLPVEEEEPLPAFSMESSDQYLQPLAEDMDMEQAGELAARTLINWIGADIENAYGIAHLAANANRRQWEISFMFEDEYGNLNNHYEINIDSVNGEVYSIADYTPHDTSYIENRTGMAEYDFYAWQETEVSSDEYAEFSKYAQQHAFTFVEKNIIAGRGLEIMSLNNVQTYEYDWGTYWYIPCEFYITLSDDSIHYFSYFNQPQGVVLSSYTAYLTLLQENTSDGLKMPAGING